MQLENLQKEFEKTKQHLIIVEGKKDKSALEYLGFKKIFIIHGTGKSIPETIEEIESIAGKDKICILTDFDKRGEKLYLLLKSELSQRKVKLDNTLRKVLLKLKISHIEGLKNFIENKEN